jgi:N utilization substance protein B
MGGRRKARELALQMMYQIDLVNAKLEQMVTDFQPFQQCLPSIQDFSLDLVKRTLNNRQAIDELLAQCAQNWRIERMAIIDRNILRLSICELLYFPDIPGSVTINEAVEIAKKYGSEESSKFVNGILDAIARGKCPEKLEFPIKIAPEGDL